MMKRKEVRLIGSYVSIMINIVLACLLVVCLTYGGAFGSKYSFGLSGFAKSDYLVLMYNGGKVVNYWVIEDGIVTRDEMTKTTLWETDGNSYWATGTVIVVDVKDRNINYEKLQEKYNMGDKEIEDIQEKLGY